MKSEYRSREAVGARLFVAIVFGVLSTSFIVETGVMIWEYGDLSLAMMSFDSHLFLFFPTFGLVALFAFWRAAVVIVDSYWRRVPFGKVMLVASLAGVTLLSAFLAWTFQSAPNRAWWEVAKPLLVADQGQPAGCRPPDCERAPIVQAYASVREAARTEGGLADLSEECDNDSENAFRIVEVRENFCFVTGKFQDVPSCCQAKIGFKAAVNALHAQRPSLTHYVHKYLMGFKVFFLLMLLGIGIMLARRRQTLERHYPRTMEQVERTMPIGGLSMLLWPLMNQAYTQSFDMLYGAGGSGAFRVTAPLYTLAIAGWAMILLFYYFRRYPKATEGAAKAIGALAAGIGIVKFDVILAYVNHFLGAGSHVVSVAVLVVVVLFLIYETLFHVEDQYDEDDTKPFEKAPLEGSDKPDPVTPVSDFATELAKDITDAIG
jgi:hypothetical protein